MKRAIKIGGVVAGLVLLLGLAGLWIVRTGWFREKLRQRVVAELEQATGGRVEIARFDFYPGLWRVRLEGIIIHGTEGPGQKPLFQAEAAEADLKIVSLLRRQVNLARLRCLGPEVHLSFAADGSSNLPQPKGRKEAGLLSTRDLLDLAVGQLAIERGGLWWNDRRYALEIAVADLRARMTFHEAGRYTGRIEAGRAVFPSLPLLPAVEGMGTDFQLLRDRIEFGELRVKTGRSEVKLGGAVSRLAEPRLELRYEARVDAEEVGRALRLPELKDGEFQVQGQGLYDAGRSEWTADGKLAAQQLAASRADFKLRPVTLSGQYHTDPRRLRLEGLRVGLWGGEWIGSMTAERPSNHRASWAAKLEGRLSGIQMEAVAEALATPSRSLAGLGWASVISGSLEAETTLPPVARSLSVRADLALAPENTGGQNPVQGVMRASYEGRTSRLQLSELRLATAASSVSASGALGSTGPLAVQFQLTTSRLEEIRDAAAALAGVRTEIPLRLNGRAMVQGRLSGTAAAPELKGTLDVTQFAYEGRDWDSLGGRFEWSPRRLRFVAGHLTKDKASVSLNLSARLSEGRLTKESPLEAEVSVRDIQAADLAGLAGQKTPFQGAVTASLKFQGTQKDPRGAGRVEVRRGTAWGEPFDALRAAVALESGEIRATNLLIAKSKGTLSGAASYHLDQKTFRFDLGGKNLALSDQQWLASTPGKLEGIAAFTFAGAGRLAAADSALENLSLDGNLRVQKASLDGEPLGDLSAEASTVGDRLRLRLESNLLGAEMKGSGEMVLRDQFATQGHIEFRHLDLSSLLRLTGAVPAPQNASADGEMTVTGEPGRAGSWATAGALTRLELGWPAGQDHPGFLLQNPEPVRWRLANQKLTLESLHLTGEGSDLRSSGTIDLGPAGTANLNLRGALNLAVLHGFESRLDASGLSTLDATLTGGGRKPELQGRLEIRDAAFRLEGSPLGISRANGVLVFSRNRAFIQKLTAEAGGGDLSLSGDADYSGRPITYRLRAEGHRIRLRYRQGISAVVEGMLNFSGTNLRSFLSGEVRVMRAGISAHWDLGSILAGLKQPTRTPSSNDWLEGAQLDVRIVSAPDIRFDTTLARNIEADADLRLRGTALNPALLGRISINQGELQFQGTRYILSRGDISFSNPFRIDPILNLDVQTRVSGYDITLTLSGPTDKLNVSYRSDPPLPFNDLITLLAVGRAPTIDPTLAAQQTAQARSLTQLGASTVIGQALAQPTRGRLQRFFGVSRIKLDPQNIGPEGNPGARITVEQQVGNDITFTYISSLASTQEQIVRIEWVVDKQWSLVAVRDQNGLFGVDVLYKKRYR
ncbi:MAG: translocation/assembly module TamB domain-containing protein [Acidobacteria bacterium]|nr:translocation/assembly module TamB domain-containing protein [Acidobacteriota bacterium]